ncbi:zinc knuckle CX2CX4HX4C containing protein, partial [Tanacetum coccineum]
YEDFVCSNNKNERNVSSSTVKDGETKEVEGVVESSCEIGIEEVVQKTSLDQDRVEICGSENENVNVDCNNGGKVNTEGINSGVLPKLDEDNVCIDDKQTKTSQTTGFSKFRSYASATIKNQTAVDKKLFVIPTEMECDGSEVVVFNEDMIAEGSKRWELTVCGYFVGYSMSVNELRYNLRRMWGKYRFKEIVDYNNGVFYIKFHHCEGLEYVVNNGPWMVSDNAQFIHVFYGVICIYSIISRELSILNKLKLLAGSLEDISRLDSTK